MENIFKGIILIDNIELIGMETKLTQSQNTNFEIIAKHWKIFNSNLHQIKGRSTSSPNWVKYGLTYKENEIYNYFASIPYDLNYSYPSKMIRKKISSGYFALFHHKGKMMDIKRTVICIFKDVIPSNNLNIKNTESFRIIYFEKYDKKFLWNKDDSIIELLVPIKDAHLPDEIVKNALF
jgi:predicted transcriptional regulator YdeE